MPLRVGQDEASLDRYPIASIPPSDSQPEADRFSARSELTEARVFCSVLWVNEFEPLVDRMRSLLLACP